MPVTVPTLETPRLLLRPIELADAAQAQALFPKWDIVQFLDAHVPWPYPPDGALTFYREVALPAMARGEAWHWSIRLRQAPDQLIGSITLRLGPGKNRGFWIAKGWQGNGFAAEACDALMAFWFEELGQPLLRVEKAATNEASRKISEREGMRLVGTEERDFVGGRMTAEIWELTREEWLARRG